MATQITDRTRRIVYARSGGICELCHAHRGQELSHRNPKGMGGTSRIEQHLPAGLVHLCSWCHANVESHRDAALERGHLIVDGADPTTVRIWLWTVYGEGWFTLTDDGDYCFA